MSRRRRYARQGASRILTTPRGFGSGGVVVAPAITLTLVTSTTSATTITVTGVTSGDISTGVFGILFSINAVPPPYIWSLNTVGALTNQSIPLVLSDYGIGTGDSVYIQGYYNSDPLDTPSTRVTGTPTLTVNIVSQPMLPGVGYINIVGTGAFMIPGWGYIQS